MTNGKHGRAAKGEALTASIAFVGVFLIAAIGMFAFEVSCFCLAQEQLKNDVDAAALAGQATLAMYSPTAARDWQTQDGYSSATNAQKAEAAAMAAAYNIFKQNSVLGSPVANEHEAWGEGIRLRLH